MLFCGLFYTIHTGSCVSTPSPVRKDDHRRVSYCLPNRFGRLVTISKVHCARAKAIKTGKAVGPSGLFTCTHISRVSFFSKLYKNLIFILCFCRWDFLWNSCVQPPRFAGANTVGLHFLAFHSVKWRCQAWASMRNVDFPSTCIPIGEGILFFSPNWRDFIFYFFLVFLLVCAAEKTLAAPDLFLVQSNREWL